MYIHKRLLIVGIMLVLAALACDANESEDIIAGRQELTQAAGTLNANSRSTEEALATARVEATATRAYFETEEALVVEATATQANIESLEANCPNLTPEECANVGSRWYTGTVESNMDECTAPQDEPQISFTFSFEDDWVQYNRFVASSIEEYHSHTRVATNTYQFTYQEGLTIDTITFSQNGFVEEVSFSTGCILTYTYTLSE